MKQYKYFSISQWEKEEEYLRNQHKLGYRFDHVSFPGIYHFTKCEPEDVIYQLDYNPDNCNDKQEYIQMFNDCGWEYIQDFFGYSYFRKAASKMTNEEEIYSDAESKLDMIKKSFKYKLSPLLILFVSIIIPQLINWSSRFYEDTLCKFLCLFFAFMLILYIGIFIHFGIEYFKIKNRIIK